METNRTNGEPELAYLDNAATTRVRDEVLEAMLPYFGEHYGNPSSRHLAGWRSRQALDEARARVAAAVGAAEPEEIVFTGCGSEANSLAIRGVAAGPRKGSLVTSPIEHKSVLRCAEFLQQQGREVWYLAVDDAGRVSSTLPEEASSQQVALCSVMLVNNEIGTVQNVAAMADVFHARGALFHTDAVQALGKIDVGVDELGVDLLSLSAHKIHGPKGVGALFVRAGVRDELVPLVLGGPQEGELRAGTENVAAIVGFGVAAELAVREREANSQRVLLLRKRLEARLRLVPGVSFNMPAHRAVPHILNVSLAGVDPGYLVNRLSELGVCVSTGSACLSTSLRPSHVLRAIGLSDTRAHSALRFSLSPLTREVDVDRAVEILGAIVAGAQAVPATTVATTLHL